MFKPIIRFIKEDKNNIWWLLSFYAVALLITILLTVQI